MQDGRCLSYPLSYHFLKAQRQKRSISLPSDLADAIDRAATAEGTTVSAWIAETAEHRLRIDAGRQGVAEWNANTGATSPAAIPLGSHSGSTRSCARHVRFSG